MIFCPRKRPYLLRHTSAAVVFASLNYALCLVLIITITGFFDKMLIKFVNTRPISIEIRLLVFSQFFHFCFRKKFLVFMHFQKQTIFFVVFLRCWKKITPKFSIFEKSIWWNNFFIWLPPLWIHRLEFHKFKIFALDLDSVI